MTRKYSEDKVREALGSIDLDDLVVFKPQDMPGPTQNRKPADFLVWWGAWLTPTGRGSWPGAGWIEVKETPNHTAWPFDDLRPSQRLGLEQAVRINLPYILVVYFRSLRQWGVIVGPKLLDELRNAVTPSLPLLRFHATCPTSQLGSTLRAALLGEWSD